MGTAIVVQLILILCQNRNKIIIIIINDFQVTPGYVKYFVENIWIKKPKSI